jgi:hypothetical protein
LKRKNQRRRSCSTGCTVVTRPVAHDTTHISSTSFVRHWLASTAAGHGQLTTTSIEKSDARPRRHDSSEPGRPSPVQSACVRNVAAGTHPWPQGCTVCDPGERRCAPTSSADRWDSRLLFPSLAPGPTAVGRAALSSKPQPVEGRNAQHERGLKMEATGPYTYYMGPVADAVDPEPSALAPIASLSLSLSLHTLGLAAAASAVRGPRNSHVAVATTTTSHHSHHTPAPSLPPLLLVHPSILPAHPSHDMDRCGLLLC